MIELAPSHKHGLVIDNPVMLGAGAIGCGEALHRSLDTSCLGAVVLGPLTRNSRGGAPPPRLAHALGGFVLRTDLQNRGVNSAVRKFSKRWARLGCPVIIHIADQEPHEVAAVVERLVDQPAVQGLELSTSVATISRLGETLAAIHSCSDFPVWLKVPISTVEACATAAADAGADGLVIGHFAPVASTLQAPIGTNLEDAEAIRLSGSPYGPLLFTQMLAALMAVKKLALPLTLIASGGIHTVEQARHALGAGASAIQLDSAVWVEPGLPAQLAAALG